MMRLADTLVAERIRACRFSICAEEIIFMRRPIAGGVAMQLEAPACRGARSNTHLSNGAQLTRNVAYCGAWTLIASSTRSNNRHREDHLASRIEEANAIFDNVAQLSSDRGIGGANSSTLVGEVVHEAELRH
jgi:hypothetical protein